MNSSNPWCSSTVRKRLGTDAQRDEAVPKRTRDIGTLLREAYEDTNKEGLTFNQKIASFIKCSLAYLVRDGILQTMNKHGIVEMAALRQEIDQFLADLGSLKTHWHVAKHSW